MANLAFSSLPTLFSETLCFVVFAMFIYLEMMIKNSNDLLMLLFGFERTS